MFLSSYGTISTDDPSSALNFLLQMYRPLVISGPSEPGALAPYTSAGKKDSAPDVLTPSMEVQLLKARLLKRDERARAVDDLAAVHYRQLARVPQMLDLLCTQLTHTTAELTKQPALYSPYQAEMFQLAQEQSIDFISAVEGRICVINLLEFV